MNPTGGSVTCQDVCVSGSDGLNLHDARLCSLVGAGKKKERKRLRCDEQIMYQKVHGWASWCIRTPFWEPRGAEKHISIEL